MIHLVRIVFVLVPRDNGENQQHNIPYLPAVRRPQEPTSASGPGTLFVYEIMFDMNKDPRPKSLQQVDIPFKKDDKKIWELDLPVEEMPISQLVWHFKYPFWEKEGTDDWNLTPQGLINDPEKEPTHYKQIQKSDLSYPVQIYRYKNRWLLLDGVHRLVKAYLAGKKTIKVRKVPKSAIPLIKTGMWSDS